VFAGVAIGSAALAWKLRRHRPAARDLITQERSSK
jgi:hypothetical protein